MFSIKATGGNDEEGVPRLEVMRELLLWAAKEIPGVKVFFHQSCDAPKIKDTAENLVHGDKCCFLVNHRGPHSWEE